MKKLLALVLALVMTLSLAVVGSNAAFTDADKVKDTYAEAVDVLSGMGVFNGYTDGTFQPEGAITRAEVAAIVYRIYTADVKDKNISLYEGYGTFTDLAGANWAKGYIGYCANAGLVKGYDAKTFGPSDKVTGYQALAMILRAMGYDKNGEFTGTGWELHVAQIAQQLGILKNAGGENLNAAASRQLVAELLFQAIQKDCVSYTPAFGYVSNSVVGKQDSLGVKNFGLTKSGATSDEWGRPSHVWYDARTTTDGKYNELKSTVYATITDKADATYTVATTECDIAAALGQKTNKTFTLYTNGKSSQYEVQPLDTVQKLGAQGTLLEVYNDAKVIVAIDTFLAKVTDVKEAAYDAAGHLKAPSMITLAVYGSTNGQSVTLTNGSDNYGYVKGDYVLVNAYTNNSVVSGTGAVTVGVIDTTSKQVTGYGTTSYNVAAYAEIVGKADSIEGAQTFIWYNNLKHTVNGTNYDDAKWFVLDEAGTETSNHTWFFDSYGNLIGAVDIATQYTYGIIENIQWQNPALSNGYAQATIRYMDGTTETKVITKINGNTLTYATLTRSDDNLNVVSRPVSLANGYVSTTMQENADEFFGTDLYRIETAADGTVSLNHVSHTDTVNSVKNEYVSQLTNATIKGNGTLTALAAITGTAASGDSHSVIYTNSNTTFLVRTGNTTKGYTYTVVKGYENVANYTGATVDYVNLDGDSYADYVYITGDADNASYYGMFYLTSNVAQQYLKTNNGGTDYYELTGILDGKTTTVKLDAAAVYADGDQDKAVSALTKAQLEAKLSSYLNKMSVVYVVNDRVMGIWGPKGDLDSLYTQTHNNKAYENLALDYQAASSTAGAITKNGNVLQVNGVYYNILNNLTTTTNGYAWGETEDLSNKNVYVVYDTSLYLGNTTYVAKEVYVADAASSGTDSGLPSVTTGSAHYTVNFYDSNNGALTLTKDATEKGYAPGTYAYGTTAGANTYTAAAILNLVGANPSAWTTSYCTPVVTVVAGGTAEVVLNVYPTPAQ